MEGFQAKLNRPVKDGDLVSALDIVSRETGISPIPEDNMRSADEIIREGLIGSGKLPISTHDGQKIEPNPETPIDQLENVGQDVMDDGSDDEDEEDALVRMEDDVNEDFSYVSKKDGKTYRMTAKEKLFCESYLEHSGNGVEAIISAGYDVWKKDRNGNPLFPNRKMAAVMAYHKLRKVNLSAYIDSLLTKYGFNDDSVEKQHLFLLNQHADLRTKAKAIDMFYKVKGRYAPEKHDHTTAGESLNAPMGDLAQFMIQDRAARAEALKAKLAE